MEHLRSTRISVWWTSFTTHSWSVSMLRQTSTSSISNSSKMSAKSKSLRQLRTWTMRFEQSGICGETESVSAQWGPWSSYKNGTGSHTTAFLGSSACIRRFWTSTCTCWSHIATWSQSMTWLRILKRLRIRMRSPMAAGSKRSPSRRILKVTMAKNRSETRIIFARCSSRRGARPTGCHLNRKSETSTNRIPGESTGPCPAMISIRLSASRARVKLMW